MSDPLSVSASIAGLVTITDAVFCRAFKYVKAVKGASNEVANLASAIGSLSGILHNLHLLACQLEGETFDTTIQTHHLHSCYQTVEKVRKILDKFDVSSTAHGLDTMKRLRWPFSVPEAKNLTSEVERHKTTLSVALAADGLSGLLQALSRQKDLQTGVDDIKSELKRKREVETHLTISEERRKILAWIQKHDPHQNHDMALRLRHPGTGLWLLESEEFKSWLRIPNSRLWYYAIPGAGKTVLASSIIQDALERSSASVATVFFYCDYKNGATQNPKNILGSLANQLAVQDEQSFEKLQAFYEKKNPEGLPSIDFSIDEVRDLVVTMTTSFDDTMVIVDALDECGTSTQIQRITALLASLNDDEGTNTVKTLFLSRDEPDIRDVLDEYGQVSIAASTTDLRLYVGAEIKNRTRNKILRIKDSSLIEQIMERLVDGADGMFRWVACQMDHLCELPNDAARRKALNSLPPTLHATYERILERVNKSNTDVQLLVQRSLRWLVCSRGPLTSLALCEAISINPGDRALDRSAISEEDEILRWCSSLVRKSIKGTHLELAHFTVKEYLTMGIDPQSEEVRNYYCGPGFDHAELAETCLTYLSFHHFADNIIVQVEDLHDRLEAFAFREYAVNNWAGHAQDHLDKPQVFALTQQLLHPSRPPIFTSWARDLLEDTFDGHGPDLALVSPLHFAAALALPEICAWLLRNGCSVDQRCNYGTVLDCALVGVAALDGEFFELPLEVESGYPRLSTVKQIINDGADVQYSSISSSPIYICIGIFDVVSCIELLRKGATIEDDVADRLLDDLGFEFAAEVLKDIEKTEILHKDYALLLESAMRSVDFTPNASLQMLQHRTQSHSAEAAIYLDPFVTAAEYGHFDVLQRLLHDHKLDVNAFGTRSGRPALHTAVVNDHVEIVDFLLRQGADHRLPDAIGRIPLHYAVEKTSRCLHLLLNWDIDIDLGDRNGLTVWHLAASKHNLDGLHILRDLSGNSADRGRLKASDGRTPLHCAAQSGSKETIAFFLDACNKDVTRDVSVDGMTALHYAVQTTSADSVQYLLNNNWDTHALTNDESSTLHSALHRDFPAVLEIVDLLLGRGVDPCKARKDGMTPIHVLLMKGQEVYANNNSWKLEKLLKKLVQHASQLDSQDMDGLTALHYVCQLRDNISWRWRPTTLEILLENGADLNIQDRTDSTALMHVIDLWKREVTAPSRTTRNSPFFYIPDTAAAVISVMLDHTKDTILLSRACADPHLLYLALMFKEEALANKILRFSPPVDAVAYQISNLNCLQIACKDGCSRELLEKLLLESKLHKEGAGSVLRLLHHACVGDRSNPRTTVTDLLSMGLDPNERDSDGRSPVMSATTNNDLTSVESLIRHGADVSATDRYGWSVVHFACQAGRPEFLHYLLSIPMDWNTKVTIHLGGELYRDANALHVAAMYDNCALEFLLDNGLVADINQFTRDKLTPLWVAAAGGISKNVSLLLAKAADDTLVSLGSESPLHIASSFGYTDVVMVLVSNGSNQQLQMKDSSGFTPELVARKYGHFKVADCLRKKASEAVVQECGNEILEGEQRTQLPSEQLKLAIDLGDLDLCQALLKKGTNTDGGFLDCVGCTPVLYSFANAQFEIAEYLILQDASIAGATCAQSTSRGYTPFHYAATYGLFNTLQVLFEKAPKGIAMCCRPVHPIFLAIAGGHLECVKLIIEHARQDDEFNTNHICGGYYNLKHLNELQICDSELRWRWRLTSAFTIQGLALESATSLHMAAVFGQVDIMMLLLDFGASVHAVDRYMKTALHFAAEQGRTQVVKALIQFGAMANTVTTSLETPCLLAARRGFLEPIKILLKRDADVGMTNKYGCTALRCAAGSGAWEICIFLISDTKCNELNVEDLAAVTPLCGILRTGPPFMISFLLNLAPNPSVYEFHRSNVLTAMVECNRPVYLKMLLRRLPENLIPRLLSHRAAVFGTPLYAAATRPAEKVIDTLLEAGADLELEGGEHGTPLMGACAAGRLAVVEILMSKGAKTSYVRDGQMFSVITAARLHPQVIRWLLVGRFMESPRLILKGGV